MKKIFFILCLMSAFVAVGQSLKLAINGSCVNAGDLDISGNQVTLEATILLTDVNANNIISKHYWEGDDNYLLRPYSFEITTSTDFYYLTVPYTYELNKWYHVAATYDGAVMKYYVNGCLVTQMAATGTLILNDYPMTIGYSIVRNSEQFYGNIDEVRIWNVARTQAQIQGTAINLPNPTTQTGLKLYYKFSNNYTNLQGNTAFNGTAVGSPTFNAAEMSALPATRPITEGLVAYYPFTGNARDSSGNNNHGTVNGATLTTDRFGIANRAYNFNGINNYIEVRNNATLQNDTNDFTISAWIQTTNTNRERIFSKGSGFCETGYAMRTIEGSNAGINLSASSGGSCTIYHQSSRPANNGVWHLITGVIKRNQSASIYIDGVLDNSTQVNSSSINLANNLNAVIGYSGYSSDPEFFNGKIDDIRMYNRALTECEVSDLYEQEHQTDLIAWYPFSGNARDSSGNNFHGTITGATFATDRFGQPNKALSFNGISDFVSVTDNDTLDIGQKDYSIVAWIKTNSTSWGRIVSKGSSGCATGYMMRTGDNTAANIHLENAFQGSCYVNSSGNRIINDNNWHCVAGTIKRDSFAKIYVDGSLDKQILLNTSTISLKNNLNLLIGANQAGFTAEWFKGSIDEVQIYGKVLTESEISNVCGLKTSVVDKVIKENFTIYPNPAHDKLTINLKNTEGSIKVKATITDVVGHTLIQQTINAPQAEINVGLLTNGLYLIILETANGRSVRKFVKN